MGRTPLSLGAGGETPRNESLLLKIQMELGPERQIEEKERELQGKGMACAASWGKKVWGSWESRRKEVTNLNLEK